MENLKKGFEEMQKDVDSIYIEDEYLILNYRYPYEIELSRLNTHSKILGWVLHLNGKNWMTPFRINAFIEKAIKANGLQDVHRL